METEEIIDLEVYSLKFSLGSMALIIQIPLTWKLRTT
jgi:hypothetical protein